MCAHSQHFASRSGEVDQPVSIVLAEWEVSSSVICFNIPGNVVARQTEHVELAYNSPKLRCYPGLRLRTIV